MRTAILALLAAGGSPARLTRKAKAGRRNPL